MRLSTRGRAHRGLKTRQRICALIVAHQSRDGVYLMESVRIVNLALAATIFLTPPISPKPTSAT